MKILATLFLVWISISANAQIIGFDSLSYLPDKQAEPKIGYVNFVRLIRDSTRYPENKHKFEGTVYVEMFIEPDSSCTIIGTFKGPSKLFDEEAVRVVCLACDISKWIPGEHHSKPVRQKFVMPVKIYPPEKTKTERSKKS